MYLKMHNGAREKKGIYPSTAGRKTNKKKEKIG